MHGRQLYYRLVFLLGMDPSLSIEIIAFWLLVEGNSEVDFLRRINSFHGDRFLALVATGKQFIDALHGNLVDLKSRSAREFHSQVMLGICFFLNNVCYKVLTDLRQKAEHGVAIHDIEESPSSNYHVLPQHMKDRHHSYHHYQGGCSISRSMPSAISLEDIEESPDSNYHGLQQYMKDRPHISSFLSEWDNTFPQSSTMNMDPYVHSPVPQDDRTLFVTFSIGYPLTKKEVYNFFMSNFGDVESLSIEEPVELRPPQYAVVIFGSLETVLLILSGKEKVKFVIGGKHLWARKYVPKNKKNGKSKAWM
ncbi:uncharacterized protein [Setaria viridis]|uniref:uncharacterized protein n=1 Tax=Setaria viridis TaxID=4556 RepID=UPI003B3B9E0F